jgi:hypothetical protein
VVICSRVSEMWFWVLPLFPSFSFHPLPFNNPTSL